MMWIVVFVLGAAGVLWICQGVMLIGWSLLEFIRQTIWPD